jgi:hypothetical protein
VLAVQVEQLLVVVQMAVLLAAILFSARLLQMVVEVVQVHKPPRKQVVLVAEVQALVLLVQIQAPLETLHRHRQAKAIAEETLIRLALTMGLVEVAALLLPVAQEPQLLAGQAVQEQHPQLVEAR